MKWESDTNDDLTAAVARLRDFANHFHTRQSLDIALVLSALGAAQASIPPREPTLGMVSRGARTCWDQGGEITVSNVWRAMHDAWTQEQTSGPGVPCESPRSEVSATTSAADGNVGTEDATSGAGRIGRIAPGPLDHQSAATPLAGRPDAGAVQVVTDGPAADPIADLCARLRDEASQYTDHTDLWSDAADALERLVRENAKWKAWSIAEIAARNPSVLEYMRHWEGRAERAEAERDQATANANQAIKELRDIRTERDTLRAIVRAADAMRAGTDCPLCDYGKLRNPAKEHWESCGFGQYDRARAAWKGEA